MRSAACSVLRGNAASDFTPPRFISLDSKGSAFHLVAVKSQAFRYNSKADLLLQLNIFRSEHPEARLNRAQLQQAVAFALAMDSDPTLAKLGACSHLDYSEPGD